MQLAQAKDVLHSRFEQLQAIESNIRSELENGICAQLTQKIQSIQSRRHGAGWKGYLLARTAREVFCGHLSLATLDYKKPNAVKEAVLKEDWLNAIRYTLEDGVQALLREYINSQHSTVLDLVDACRSQGDAVILVMAPYFTKERLADGYFQRVQAVDRMFPATSLKIYASWADADTITSISHVQIWDETHIEICYPQANGGNDEWIHQIARRADVVYHHSITFANELVTVDDSISKIFDMHGAYPEELCLYGRYAQAEIDERQERLAMEHGQCLVCVTQSMVRHLEEKYGQIPETVILLPIFDAERICQCRKERKKQKENLAVVYAGGMQKWQNVKMMQRAVRQAGSGLQFYFFTPDPDAFWKSWGHRHHLKNMEVCAKTPEEVLEAYGVCDYGFLLRDNTTVNRVACPTKLVEYLAAGILPILYEPNVGDFLQDGMAYISLNDFLSRNFPTKEEREDYAKQNLKVIEKMKARYTQGKKELQDWIDQTRVIGGARQ